MVALWLWFVLVVVAVFFFLDYWFEFYIRLCGGAVVASRWVVVLCLDGRFGVNVCWVCCLVPVACYVVACD